MTKLNELSVPIHDLRRFDWNRELDELACDASDLGPISRQFFSRLYNDACDLGMAIKSHHTGMVKRYYLSDEKRDEDGCMMTWHFLPVDDTGPSVVVFND